MGGGRQGSEGRGTGAGASGGFREPSPYGEPPKGPPALTRAAAARVVTKSAPPPPAGGAKPEELESLRAERDALRDRFERLERMLADPEKGENAILYYRLRTVWNLCHEDLQALVAESRRKFEIDELAGFGAALPEPQSVARAALADELAAAEQDQGATRARIADLRHDLYERDKPFRKGEKRMLREGLDEATPRLRQLEARVRELRGRLAEFDASAPDKPASPPPRETQTARRAVNTLLIALAQHYYLIFRDDQIAEMALQAARKPVDAVYFGLASECLELNRRTRELIAWARSEKGRPEAVRLRARYLRSRLRYADDVTAIPLGDSLNWLPTRVQAGNELVSDTDELLPVNVLTQNYWDVAGLLLR